MIRLYTDTNILRYFGTAFAKTNLANDLRDNIFLAPLSLMELLSQLGTAGAEEAFASVHAFPRFLNAQASGMLPWSDNFFRMCLFKLPPSEDVTAALNNAINNTLNAAKAEDMKEAGKEMRELLDIAKGEAAKNFSDVLNSWREEGELNETEHRAIFARSIAHQAGVDQASVDIELIVKSLDALYVFEKHRMQIGAENKNYRVEKHSNDVYDAELLIYLADPSCHLITSDKGFGRVEKSSQSNRVHIVDALCFQDAECAAKTIRDILKAG